MLLQFARKDVSGKVIVALFLLGICLPVGCVAKEGIYQGMYDGLKTREQVVNPERTRPFLEEPMSYRLPDKAFGRVIGRGCTNRYYPLPAAFPKTLSESLYQQYKSEREKLLKKDGSEH